MTADNFNIFCTLTRAYSLPISVTSWLIPFIFACFNDGNILFGFFALLGIIILHLASNLFDDIIDYLKELKDINNGKKTDFNFQKGKCVCILENLVSFKQALIIDFFLFFSAFIIAVFFFYVSGLKLLYIVIPTIILCLLYPVLGCLGLGEIIIAIIFSPLLYLGVYFVMTGKFSYQVLILSISTGLLSVGVLFNHSLLDYKYDTTNRKITLSRLCTSMKQALILLLLIIAGAYLNLLFWIFKGELNIIYFLPFITLPYAFKLIKEMNIYIKQDKSPNNMENFLSKFLLAQNLQKYFIIMLCISIIIVHWFKL